MKRYIFLISLLLAATTPVAAQLPLYVVNGTPTNEIASIPPNDIEHVEMLPADEQTIAHYGERASYGVMLVTLRYDQGALFSGNASLADYLKEQVVWDDDDPTARLVVRYTITTSGALEIGATLESTDARFKRRVLKALEEAPHWTPASKQGIPVVSEGILRLQLPEGRQMPNQVELIYR